MANHPTVKGRYGIDAPRVPRLWYGLAVLFIGFGINNLFAVDPPHPVPGLSSASCTSSAAESSG
jgi:hypothetical protein